MPGLTLGRTDAASTRTENRIPVPGLLVVATHQPWNIRGSSRRHGNCRTVFTRWFAARGWAPRAHQLELLAKARAGRSALLIAPTGAGKTLAGFLPTLVELSARRTRRRRQTRNLISTGRGIRRAGGLHTLYISPLKALAVDIARNLETPVAEMGLADPHRDAHRRHADLEAPAPAPRSARHPAHHAGAAGAAARIRRRAVSVRLAAGA